MERLGLAVLISGRGSNLKALIDACAEPDFPAVVRLVVSNVPGAGGLEIARSAGIEAAVVDPRDYEGKAAFEAALQTVLEGRPVDLLCLAGFMKILSAGFIENWPGRIINIHPSLLPAYRGLDTHARALADGVAESGCSVHFVTAGMDEGPVILQRKVPVMAGDSPDTLAARILAEEHRAYPEAVRMLAEGRVQMVDGKVEIR